MKLAELKEKLLASPVVAVDIADANSSNYDCIPVMDSLTLTLANGDKVMLSGDQYSAIGSASDDQGIIAEKIG